MVASAVVAFGAGACLCGGCHLGGEARALEGQASTAFGESAPLTYTRVFPSAELWPSWVAVQLAGPQVCPKQPKRSDCVWFFSTDGLEWAPSGLWLTTAQGQAQPWRHVTTQWCGRNWCRLVTMYLGPPGR
ncbi:hypothetical protein [Knoellia sp. p5-6-4]|uniref:hypothetical protein n=1 Tax=unclassified Knoellia TaxID=2618719 RepID=UPI0023DB3D7A|nr:hypothetical protein [Knoellia sp. p5-6-4]MDF2144164.1 hypothetical protein [Knoellia sp. p5-6-4]